MTQAETKNAAQPWTHGGVYWNELSVHDVARAKKFYEATIGWRFEPMPMGETTYWIIHSNDKMVGGLFEMKGPEFANIPEHWLTYIAVDDVDARLKQAAGAGAKIVKEPFDIPGVGRMAVLSEPGGAVVAWMTPKPKA